MHAAGKGGGKGGEWKGPPPGVVKQQPKTRAERAALQEAQRAAKAAKAAQNEGAGGGGGGAGKGKGAASGTGGGADKDDEVRALSACRSWCATHRCAAYRAQMLTVEAMTGCVDCRNLSYHHLGRQEKPSIHMRRRQGAAPRW